MGFPYVIVIGGNELESRTVSIKNMTDGNEQTVSIDEAIALLTQQ